MLSAMGRRSPADERRGAPTRSAAFAMSLLAHAAAMGALLMLKPTPPLATPPEVIEVTVVLEEALTSPQANNLSVAIPRDASVDAPVAPARLVNESGCHPDGFVVGLVPGSQVGVVSRRGWAPGVRTADARSGLRYACHYARLPRGWRLHARNVRTPSPCASALRIG